MEFNVYNSVLQNLSKIAFITSFNCPTPSPDSLPRVSFLSPLPLIPCWLMYETQVHFIYFCHDYFLIKIICTRNETGNEQKHHVWSTVVRPFRHSAETHIREKSIRFIWLISVSKNYGQSNASRSILIAERSLFQQCRTSLLTCNSDFRSLSAPYSVFRTFDDERNETTHSLRISEKSKRQMVKKVKCT